MISKLYEKRLRSDLFKLSIMTVMTVFIWIGFSTYQSLSKSKVSKATKLQIKPLTSTLDLDTIKSIKDRQEIIQVDWSSIKPQLPSDLQLPELGVDIDATKSGQVDDDLTASDSGSSKRE